MDSQAKTIVIDKKPCVLHYLEHFDRFIIGTYELVQTIEDARLKLKLRNEDEEITRIMDKINNRGGNLVLLKVDRDCKPNIDYILECEDGGGIFDLKFEYNVSKSEYDIYSAHSNGVVGIYKITIQPNARIQLVSTIKVSGSTMLTSIDFFPVVLDEEMEIITDTSCRGDNQYKTARILVVDSEGCVCSIHCDKTIVHKVVRNHSLWQVKCTRIREKDLVFIGAENCSWYIYEIDDVAGSFKLLYENSYQDFCAGVTSIFAPKLSQESQIELYLGSYDETLRRYNVTLCQGGVVKVELIDKQPIKVEGGGIWRIKQSKEDARSLYVAAMYAGSLRLDLVCSRSNLQLDSSTERHDSDFVLTKLVDLDSLNLPQTPLHYDIDTTSDNIFCIADFNNSLCVLGKIPLIDQHNQ